MECTYCTFTTSTEPQLRMHHTKVHYKDTKLPCKACNKTYKTLSSFYNHATPKKVKIKHIIHNIVGGVYQRYISSHYTVPNAIITEPLITIPNKTRYFKTDQKLQNFINLTLLNDKFNYISISGVNNLHNGEKRYYRCNHRENNKLSCLSFYNTLKTKNKNFYLEYNDFHNHNIIFDNIRILKQVKGILIDKIKKGISLENIYQSILDTVSGIIEFKTQLITMSYLRYLKNSYTIVSELDTSDLISLQKYIKILKNQKSLHVLINNFSSEPKDKEKESYADFLFCFQTNDQETFLQQNTHLDTLLVDSTHGTNIYNYKLLSISVLDNNHQARPICFAITSSETTDTMNLIFRALKKTNLNRLKIKFFMSDMANMFFKGFINNNPYDVIWLYCLWHVKQAIYKNLVIKIKNDDIRAEVKRRFNILAMETSVKDLKETMKLFLSYTLKSCLDFHNYFLKYYSDCLKRWALAYRKKAHVNTNMFTETQFHIIKNKYLKRVRNNRLDFLLYQLLRYDSNITKISIRNLFTENTEEKGYRAKLVVSNHKKAINLENYKIKKNRTHYLVNSYKVIIKKPYFCSNKCLLTCKECNVCIHYSTCTCLNYLSCKAYCKHIHYVGIKMEFGTNKKENRQEIINVYTERNLVESKILKKLDMEPKLLKNTLELTETGYIDDGSCNNEFKEDDEEINDIELENDIEKYKNPLKMDSDMNLEVFQKLKECLKSYVFDDNKDNKILKTNRQIKLENITTTISKILISTKRVKNDYIIDRLYENLEYVNVHFNNDYKQYNDRDQGRKKMKTQRKYN